MKVLVVEDNAADLKLISVVLTMSGHEVGAQFSAEGVARTIAMNRPDLIVIDVCLPGMDGVTLACQLKAAQATCQIPIVAVTAYSDRYPRETLLKAGCGAYFVKPIDTRKFASQMQEVVARFKRDRT